MPSPSLELKLQALSLLPREKEDFAIHADEQVPEPRQNPLSFPPGPYWSMAGELFPFLTKDLLDEWYQRITTAEPEHDHDIRKRVYSILSKPSQYPRFATFLAAAVVKSSRSAAHFALHLQPGRSVAVAESMKVSTDLQWLIARLDQCVKDRDHPFSLQEEHVCRYVEQRLCDKAMELIPSEVETVLLHNDMVLEEVLDSFGIGEGWHLSGSEYDCTTNKLRSAINALKAIFITLSDQHGEPAVKMSEHHRKWTRRQQRQRDRTESLARWVLKARRAVVLQPTENAQGRPADPRGRPAWSEGNQENVPPRRR